METLETLLWSLFLLFFSVWFMHLLQKLNISSESITDMEERFDEVIESVNVVVQILSKLPDLMPQYSINQGEGIVEKIISQVLGIDQQGLSAAAPQRGPDGRYNGEGQGQIEGPQEASQTND